MLRHIVSQASNRFGLFLILALAAALRLWHLGVRDFWYDETFTGIVVREPIAKMMNIIVQDVHPPLYYFGAKLFSSLFSYSVFGIRLYSVVFGILCVLMVYLIAANLVNKRAGLASALIAALAPFAIQYSQEARMYSQLAFLILLATYFLFRSLQKDTNRYALAWGLTLGLAVLTHYLAALFAPIFGLIILIWRIQQPGQAQEHTHKKAASVVAIIKNVGIGIAASAVLFLPWITTTVRQYQTYDPTLDWITKPSNHDFINTLQTFYLGSPPGNLAQGQIFPINHIMHVPDAAIVGVAALTLLSAVIIVIAKKRRGGSALTLLCLGPVLLLFGASFAGYDYFVTRYLLPSAFFFYILLGIAVSYVPSHFRYLMLALYVLCIVSISPHDLPTEWNSLKRNLPHYANARFYVLNPFDYVIAKYYIGTERVTLFNVDDPEKPPRGWAAIDDSLRSTSQPTEMAEENKYLITYHGLNASESLPPTLLPLTFRLVDRYDPLFVYRAILPTNQ